MKEVLDDCPLQYRGLTSRSHDVGTMKTMDHRIEAQLHDNSRQCGVVLKLGRIVQRSTLVQFFFLTKWRGPAEYCVMDACLFLNVTEADWSIASVL